MSGLEASAGVGEEFAELVYSDSEWLRAEFEALMTAGFGAPPRFPILPAPPWMPGQERPCLRGRGRQRSPPLVE